MRITRRGFTLIELLLVIAIISLLVSIVLPSLAEVRRNARGTISFSNLRQLGMAMLAYGNENKEQWLFPWNERPSPPAATWEWYSAQQRRGTQVVYWDFGDAGRETEMFAAHWASWMMHYISPGQLANPIQFSPMDTAVKLRFDQDVSQYPLDDVIWDGSYWYSPTMWFAPSRYATNFAVPQAPNRTLLRRNKNSDVTFPSSKVVLWERFDFTKKSRRAPGNVGRINQIPQWNHPEAQPRFWCADGSATQVSTAKLAELASSTDTATQKLWSPLGTWAMPTSILATYSIQNDGLENGQNGTGQYPAYFWATRNGVQGRDVPR
jgi:prepilin-type N-terminal cleavage/methylation domain-containing protein